MGGRVDLERAGWQRRGIFSEPRLSELVALYQELGYEVLVKSLEPSELEGVPCEECFVRFPKCYRVLYTRGESSCK